MDKARRRSPPKATYLELHFFYSYLNDRSQYVELNGQKSESRTIMSGVPQGTVLGPLLFTIYLDDMLQCMENRPEAVADGFADDAMIYSCGKIVTETTEKLNSALTPRPQL